MNKDQKKNYIEKMSTDIDKSQAVIVTHYQGLNMPQLDQLRKQMREHGILFKITKNRITKIALEKTRAKELSKLFAGPTAVALSDDAITSAKILTKFSKENSNLKILGGIMGDEILDVAAVQNVATLFLVIFLYLIEIQMTVFWLFFMVLVGLGSSGRLIGSVSTYPGTHKSPRSGVLAKKPL